MISLEEVKSELDRVKKDLETVLDSMDLRARALEEQVKGEMRTNIAVSAMLNMIRSSGSQAVLDYMPGQVARRAVDYADSLLAELKEKKP